jgi:uncharacterized protein YbjT (DUF2867 family)
MTFLVTGGTGTLGRPTVGLLRTTGYDVRVLSRHDGPGQVRGDLDSGIGLGDVLRGVDTVLHLATTAGRRDVAQTRRLLAVAADAGVQHLVYISIVGVDQLPFPYYRAKLECERLVEESGLDHTILRATQFHEFIAGLVDAQRRLPVVLAVDLPDQPISADEVAARLVELATAHPLGRVSDIGGPVQLRLLDAIATLQSYDGTHKPVWPLAIPGRTMRAFRDGHHLAALPGYGQVTFEEFARNRASRRRGD